MAEKQLNITIWNEYRHERQEPACRDIYPDGIHGCIKSFLETDPTLNIRLAALDDPEQGLPDEVLNTTDVLFCTPGITPRCSGRSSVPTATCRGDVTRTK